MKNKNNKSNFIFKEKPEINEIDLEMISTNISKPENDYKNIIFKIIKNLCNKSKGKIAKKNDIIIQAKSIGIDIMRVEDAIERLKRSKMISGNENQYYIK
jgi:DNA replicative helicase MCM subunit Mcm2 (Cdc46/Mcm family)